MRADEIEWLKGFSEGPTSGLIEASCVFSQNVLDWAGDIVADYSENPELIDTLHLEIASQINNVVGAASALKSSSWNPIESAPDAERVMVCGWQARTSGCRGYWWWHEDVMFDGKPTEHPNALYWTRIILPAFPEPPEAP